MIASLARARTAAPAFSTFASERVAARLIIGIAVLFNLIYLLPEVVHQTVPVNDNVLHILDLQATIDTIRGGGDPTDLWLPGIGGGYPLFHYYQHLVYIPPSLVHFATGMSAASLIAWSTYLLLSLFPLSVFVSMRRVGFDPFESAGASLAGFFATNGLFGFDYASYVWSGYGLYTQLWGMVLLPLALSQSYRVMRTGGGYGWAIGLLAALALSHLVLGYIGMGSLVGIALFCGSLRDLPRRLGRLAVLGAGFALATAYFFVPYVLDGEYLNRSPWELPSKYNSFGEDFVLGALVRGNLFDFHRLPVMTVLIVLGFIASLQRWREPRYRIGPLLGVFWLLAYFGRPTWGSLIDLLPMSHDLQLHRLIAGVHLGGLFLLGAGVGATSRFVGRRVRERPQLDQRLVAPAMALALLILLVPVLNERRADLHRNATFMEASDAGIAQEAADLEDVRQFLEQQPPGRVYAGLAANWGAGYTVGSSPMYGILSLDGFDMLGRLYHALSPVGDVQVLFNDSDPTQYDLFGVRYIVAPAGQAVPPFARLIATFGRHHIYEVPGTGYFATGDSTIVYTGSKGSLLDGSRAWLDSKLPSQGLYPEFALDGRSEANAALPVQPLANAPATIPLLARGSTDAAPGSVSDVHAGRGSYSAVVSATRPLTLVLKSTYHPNWKAEVDGEAVETFMVAPGYLALPLEQGNHQVSLVYRPQWYRKWLLLIGVAGIGAIAAGERLLRQRGILGPVEAVDALLPPTPRPEPWLPASPALAAIDDRLAAPVRGRWRRFSPTTRIAAALYLVLFGIYFITASGHFYSTDHIAVYQAAQSIVQDGDLSISPITNAVQGRGGEYYSQYGVGQVLASLPLYLLGDAVVHAFGPSSGVAAYFGGDQLGFWGGTVQIYFVSLLNQLVAPLLSVILFSFCLRLGYSTRASLATALAYGLGTLVWAGAHEYFQHVLEALGLFGCFYILFSRRDSLSPLSAALAGLVLGVGLLTRINTVLIVPLLGLYLLWTRLQALGYVERDATPLDLRRLLPAGIAYARGLSRRELQLLAAFALPLGLCVLAVMAANAIQFGNPEESQSSAVSYGFRLSTLPTGLIGNLLSPGRSVFLYSPPVLLGVVYLRRFYRMFPAEGLFIGAVALVYLVFFSTFRGWDAGLSWGPRYLEAALPFLMLPVAMALRQRSTALIFCALVALGAVVQFLGVVINVSYASYDALAKGYSPDTAFIFVPSLSPIPTHFAALRDGRHIDLWLKFVLDHFSALTFILTALVPALLLFFSVRLLWASARDAEAEISTPESQPEPTSAFSPSEPP
jgi:hypothetical protein